MGWKKLRDHYGIVHAVQVKEGRIHIGSSYIPSCIVVERDGRVWDRDADGTRKNTELARVSAAIAADPATAARLIAEPDEFGPSVKVYSWTDGNGIVEEFCETPGWPNVTHAGTMMYDNLHSTDRAETVARARRDGRLRLRQLERVAEEARKTVTDTDAEIARAAASLAALDADPDAWPGEVDDPE